MSEDSPRLDRIAQRRKDTDYLEGQLDHPDTRIVPVWRDRVIVHDRGLAMPRLAVARDLLELSAELVFLGSYAGEACFAADLSGLPDLLSHPALAGTSALHDARAALAELPQAEAETALYARALLFWHARHRFCGKCGHETRAIDGGHVRLCTRPDCGIQHFPRTDPCVLVLVHDGSQCLLGRQRGWPQGMYSALAGFVEPCESLEEAAAREVLEEAGIAIENIRYTQSQPWPFPASLMVGFVAQPTTRVIELHDAELEDARWFTRAQLATPSDPTFFVPRPYSLAGHMIAQFVAQSA